MIYRGPHMKDGPGFFSSSDGVDDYKKPWYPVKAWELLKQGLGLSPVAVN